LLYLSSIGSFSRIEDFNGFVVPSDVTLASEEGSQMTDRGTFRSLSQGT